jgi:hypothetical protein
MPYSHKRLTQQKKQRERERKELEALGRKQLANVRVVQRNVVYVTGLGSRFAKEEVSSSSNQLIAAFLIDKLLIAHPNLALQRVFRAIWQDFQDCHSEEDLARWTGASHWLVHHLPST